MKKIKFIITRTWNGHEDFYTVSCKKISCVGARYSHMCPTDLGFCMEQLSDYLSPYYKVIFEFDNSLKNSSV